MLQYFLKQIDPGNPHPIMIFLNKDEIIVGRRTIESLANYHQVSRWHASFTFMNGFWHLKDLGSLNNLYLNFQKVGRDLVKLDIGDIIGFGITSVQDTKAKSTSSESKGFLCVLTVKNVIKEEPNCPPTPRKDSALNQNTNVATPERHTSAQISKVPTSCKESSSLNLNDTSNDIIRHQVKQMEFPVIIIDDEEDIHSTVVESTTNIIVKSNTSISLSNSDDEIQYLDEPKPKKIIQRHNYETIYPEGYTKQNNDTLPSLKFSGESSYVSNHISDNNLNESKNTLYSENMRNDVLKNHKHTSYNSKLYVQEDIIALSSDNNTSLHKSKNPTLIKIENMNTFDSREIIELLDTKSNSKIPSLRIQGEVNDTELNSYLIDKNKHLDTNDNQHLNSATNLDSVQESTIKKEAMNANHICSTSNFTDLSHLRQFLSTVDGQSKTEMLFNIHDKPKKINGNIISNQQMHDSTSETVYHNARYTESNEAKTNDIIYNETLEKNPVSSIPLIFNKEIPNSAINRIDRFLYHECENSKMVSESSLTGENEAFTPQPEDKNNSCSLIQSKKVSENNTAENQPLLDIKSEVLVSSQVKSYCDVIDDYSTIKESRFQTKIIDKITCNKASNDNFKKNCENSPVVSKESISNTPCLVNSSRIPDMPCVKQEEKSSDKSRNELITANKDSAVRSKEQNINAIESSIANTYQNKVESGADITNVSLLGALAIINQSEENIVRDNINQQADISLTYNSDSPESLTKDHSALKENTFLKKTPDRQSIDPTIIGLQENGFDSHSIEDMNSERECGSENINFDQLHLKSSFLCHVKLVKCDSRHFVCPPDVRKINWGILHLKKNNKLTKTNLNDVQRKNKLNLLKPEFRYFNSEISKCNQKKKIVRTQSAILESNNKTTSIHNKSIDPYSFQQCENRTSHQIGKAFKQKISSNDEVNGKSEPLTLKPIPSENSKRKLKVNESISVESKRKSASRTLYTEPKPINIRPRSVRGREEGFLERCSLSSDQDGYCSTPNNIQSEFQNKSSTAGQSDKKMKESISSHETLNAIPDKREYFKRDSIGIKVSENVETCNRIIDISANKHLDLYKKRHTPAVSKRRIDYSSRIKFLIDTRGDKNVKDNLKDLNCADKKTCGYPNVKKKHSDCTADSTPKAGISEKHFTELCDKQTTRNKNDRGVWKKLHNLEPVVINEEKLDTTYSYKSPGKYSAEVKEKNVMKTKSNYFHKSKKVAVVSPVSQIVQKKTESSGIDRQEYTLTRDALIEVIIGWNPKWLDEQKINRKPPPVIARGAGVIPLTFSSYKEYVVSLYPLIVIDIWCKLFEESKLLQETNNWNSFYFSILSFEDKATVTELTCQSLIAHGAPYFPCEGNITLLNIKHNEHSIDALVFGYIKSHNFEVVERNTIIPSEWSIIPVLWTDKSSLWTFKVTTKKRQFSYPIRTLLFGYGISNMVSKFQLVDAICSFRNSPLLDIILHPKEDTFLKIVSNCHLLPTTSGIEEHKIIQELFDDIMQTNSTPKVILLSGPSGTGKTSTIIKLISKLIKTDPSQRILVSASSESELDEIGCQLLSMKECYSQPIKLIKLDSLTENTRPLLRSYTLQTLAQSYCKYQYQKDVNAIQEKINLMETSINEALFLNNDQSSAPANERNDYLNTLISQYTVLKEQKNSLCNEENVELTSKRSVLREYNVFLSTPESLSQSLTFFKDLGPFSCCLVDSASRCVELEILRCLTIEFNKLILFGDPQQFPFFPDQSFLAKYGYYRSLFGRFYDYFKKKNRRTPPLTLKKQYRMHSDICSFVSTFFYNKELLTHRLLRRKYSSFPLKPYVVYDVIDEPPDNSTDEMVALSNVCLHVRQMAPEASMGVISPTPAQTAMYHQILSGSDFCRYVEINLAEEYLGREKDVVIVSCIRCPGVPEGALTQCENLLNLALTRAKQCLILIGHLSSFKSYHWRCLLDDARQRNLLMSTPSLKRLPLLVKNFIINQPKNSH